MLPSFSRSGGGTLSDRLRVSVKPLSNFPVDPTTVAPNPKDMYIRIQGVSTAANNRLAVC